MTRPRRTRLPHKPARRKTASRQRRRKRSRRRHPPRSPAWRDRVRRAAWQTTRSALLIALPFSLLVRGSVTAHRTLGTHGWISVSIGAALATFCLAVLLAWIWRRLTGRARLRPIARNIAMPAVAIFCLYSLGWLSSFNAKSPEIHALYRDLHPSLRLAISTAILTDSGVLITEIARTPSDYPRMGLAPVARSLHFEQPDGWIHAIDLRTRGRSTLRNALSKRYFQAMGFRALRHGGTGDHLHIALPRPLR